MANTRNYGHDIEPYIHAIRYREVSLSQETAKCVLSKCLLFRRISLFQKIEPVLDHLNIHGKVQKHEFIYRDDGFFSGALIVQMSSTEEVDTILDQHAALAFHEQALQIFGSVEKYKGMRYHQDLKLIGDFILRVNLPTPKKKVNEPPEDGSTLKDYVFMAEGIFDQYNFTRIVPITAKGKFTGAVLIAFASAADCHKAREAAVRLKLKVVDCTGHA